MSRFKEIIALLCLCLYVGGGSGEKSVHEWRKSQVYYSSKGHQLRGHVIKEHNNFKTVTQCAMQCYRTEGCESLNFEVSSSLCELNSVSDVEVPVNEAPGWLYYRRDTYAIEETALGPCSARPCHNGAGCINRLTADGQPTYLCICQKGYMGETCDEPEGVIAWGAWSAWGACSVTCGAGWQSRDRQCTHNGQAADDSLCAGPVQEYRACPGLEPCPYWGEWGEWGECSVVCGQGSERRERECLHGGVPGDDRMCMGQRNETKTCYRTSCTAPVKLSGGNSVGEGVVHVLDDVSSKWVPLCASQWSQHNTKVACQQLGYTAGQATSGKETVAGDQTAWMVDCDGTEATLQSCPRTNTQCPDGFASVQCTVAGGWSAWSEWGECSVTCAHGTQLRARTCDYPPALRGGEPCADAPQDSRPCVEDPCPVDGAWKPWGAWGACNETCGGGWQLRTRECDDPEHGGQDCTGPTDDIRQCNTHNCPVACEWNTWSTWGECTVTCGGGQQMRTRTKNGPFYGGADCEGSFDSWQDCNMHECPVDCVWEEWGEWEACSVECGGGQKTRHRQSDGPYHNGRECEGEASSVEDCNMHECPIDCAWDTWSDWSICNRSCGGGWQQRERSSDGPYYGGNECSGQHDEARLCNTHDCPENCVWNTWGMWSECSLSCGSGSRSRTRSKEGPRHGGADCEGLPDEDEACNTQPCPIDGVWNEWGEWGECSETCAMGIQHRERTCQEPQHGGLPCSGDTSQQQECSLRPCPVDGEWHQWGEWSACSLMCGHGKQSRVRQCETPQHGGESCDGAGEEERECNAFECPVNGYWETWSEWGACSVSCGGGLMHRQRTCVEPLHGGTPCEGDTEEQAACEEQHCPIDGVWEEWGLWLPCTVTCGGGSQHRERSCTPPQYGGSDCDGDAQEHRDCNMMLCPVDGEWSEWSTWETCSLTCGGGEQRRYRVCGGKANGGSDCEGDEEQWQDCNTLECPVDCVWSEYGAWGACNQTCGGGWQVRERTADGPYHNGQPCEGDAQDWMACNTHPCPIDCVWEEWSEWAVCDVSCGGGTQGRQRGKSGPYHLGNECVGEPDEQRTCNTDPCPVDCVWEAWSEWAVCSVTCGGGRQSRTRDTLGPFHGGAECPGEAEQQQDCNTHPCPIDCAWEEWAEWAVCSVTCGGGTQGRARSSQGPFHGGADCDGEDSQTQDCNVLPCPVDCVWHEWAVWGSCTVSCGGGTQVRDRTKEGPFHNGNECDGNSQEIQDCNEEPCPVDCVWEVWTAWGECDVTCGGGEQQRSRGKDGPHHGGQPCEGDTLQTQACNTLECPVDCIWSEWSDWEPCSLECGGGSQNRNRQKIGPFHNGADCDGETIGTQECNTHHCPIDGVWQNWSDWSECTVTCGGGSTKRDRECTPPQYGGQECMGDQQETEPCSENPCPIPGEWLAWAPWGVCSATCGGGTRQRTRDCDMDSHGDLTAPCEGDAEETEACHTFDCSPFARTCDEWVERGLVDSNWVQIDPDGPGYGWGEFLVWCDLTDPANALTIVHHNFESETPVKGYEGAGEYEAELIYQDNQGRDLEYDQVSALVDSSLECKQFIRWSCSSASFNPDMTQLMAEGRTSYKLTFWLNRYAEEMNYWGGSSPTSDPNSVTCGCYAERTCADPTKRCNCDSNDIGVWRADEGYLTNKDDLPVTKFQAGDTGELAYGEEGAFSVGPLICGGTGSYFNYYNW